MIISFPTSFCYCHYHYYYHYFLYIFIFIITLPPSFCLIFLITAAITEGRWSRGTHGKATLDAGVNGLHVLVVHQAVMHLQGAHGPHGIQHGEVGWVHRPATHPVHLEARVMSAGKRPWKFTCWMRGERVWENPAPFSVCCIITWVFPSCYQMYFVLWLALHASQCILCFVACSPCWPRVPELMPASIDPK